MPVLRIEKLEDAVPLASALVEGGINVLEITLRTPIALEAIQLIAEEVEDAVVGVGTVLNSDDLKRAADAGAVFAVSPGLTDALAQTAAGEHAFLPLLPGVSTSSELMRACDAGFSHFKFFPADAAGGRAMLKSLYGPFADCVFCPTGGVTVETAPDYLALPNVACVGGTWLAPADAIADKDWAHIRSLAQVAAGLTPR